MTPPSKAQAGRRPALRIAGLWAGLFVGAAGWALHQQGLADTLYYRCGAGRPGTDIVVTLLTSVLMLAAMAWSWRIGRAEDAAEPGGRARRLAMWISVGAGALFLLTTLVQAAAGLIVPACFR